MTQFHTDEYVEFLHRVMPETAHQYAKEQVKCGSHDQPGAVTLRS